MAAGTTGVTVVTDMTDVAPRGTVRQAAPGALDALLVEHGDDADAIRVLGLARGTFAAFRAAPVCRRGVGQMAYSTNIGRDALGNIELGVNDVFRLMSFSDVSPDQSYPLTSVGSGTYLNTVDWCEKFGITAINGTNSFPFFGWGGKRLGTTKPQSKEYSVSALYSYPTFYLEQSKTFNPIGLLYPGQLVQITCAPTPDFRDERRTIAQRAERAYTRPADLGEPSEAFVVPFQEGRGSFDFMSRDVLYNPDTLLIESGDTTMILPAEGAVPGRNCASFGMAVSDSWTPDGVGARNAPLTTTVPGLEMPWDAGYKTGENVRVVTEGVTTGLVSGAVGIYRGQGCSTWAGSSEITEYYSTCIPRDQYYTTYELWKRDQTEPATSQVSGGDFPLQAELPFRTKGGKIALTADQVVRAGSLVYACVQNVQNVTMPQFIPPAAKEITIEDDFRSDVLADVYSKFQGNQGGLIVVPHTEGAPPPNPPSHAVPVGVILETVRGRDVVALDETDGMPVIEVQRTFKGPVGEYNVTKAKMESLEGIQNRPVLFRIFPCAPDLRTNAVSAMCRNLLAFIGPDPQTVCAGDYRVSGISGQAFNEGVTRRCPIFHRVRTNYYVPVGRGGFVTKLGDTLINGWGFKEKQSRNDYPPVQ